MALALSLGVQPAAAESVPPHCFDAGTGSMAQSTVIYRNGVATFIEFADNGQGDYLGDVLLHCKSGTAIRAFSKTHDDEVTIWDTFDEMAQSDRKYTFRNVRNALKRKGIRSENARFGAGHCACDESTWKGSGY